MADGFADESADGLLRAARDGKSLLAIELTRSGADVRRSGAQGDTALHWAAFHGMPSLARLLIERGAPVNARVRNGNTPLHQATYKGHLEVVALLVGSGAAVGAVNQLGVTPTQWAHQKQHDAVLEYLLAHGGRLDPVEAQTVRSDPQRLIFRRSDVALRHVQASANAVTSSARWLGTPARKLSTSLGDLPPLVLRMAVVQESAGPSLKMEEKIGYQSSSAAQLDSSLASRKSVRLQQGSSWIQLGSFSTQARAHAGWRQAVNTHSDLLSGLTPSIVTAQVGVKGEFHRLRLGPLLSNVAIGLCAALTARNAPCLVLSERKQN